LQQKHPIGTIWVVHWVVDHVNLDSVQTDQPAFIGVGWVRTLDYLHYLRRCMRSEEICDVNKYLVLNPSSVGRFYSKGKEFTGLNSFKSPLELSFFFLVAAAKVLTS